jgi:hypothetical protein
MTNKETANADLEYLLLRVPTSFSHGKKQDEGPWLIPQGTKAVDAAEVIHADIKKSFPFFYSLGRCFFKKGALPPFVIILTKRNCALFFLNKLAQSKHGKPRVADSHRQNRSYIFLPKGCQKAR